MGKEMLNLCLIKMKINQKTCLQLIKGSSLDGGIQFGVLWLAFPAQAMLISTEKIIQQMFLSLFLHWCHKIFWCQVCAINITAGVQSAYNAACTPFPFKFSFPLCPLRCKFAHSTSRSEIQMSFLVFCSLFCCHQQGPKVLVDILVVFYTLPFLCVFFEFLMGNDT